MNSTIRPTNHLNNIMIKFGNAAAQTNNQQNKKEDNIMYENEMILEVLATVNEKIGDNNSIEKKDLIPIVRIPMNSWGESSASSVLINWLVGRKLLEVTDVNVLSLTATAISLVYTQAIAHATV